MQKMALCGGNQALLAALMTSADITAGQFAAATSNSI
jgi:hypothetical protein